MRVFGFILFCALAELAVIVIGCLILYWFIRAIIKVSDFLGSSFRCCLLILLLFVSTVSIGSFFI